MDPVTHRVTERIADADRRLVSRAERLGLGDASPDESYFRAKSERLADAYARTFDYGDSFLEPDEFTGAECDVDALAAARAADRGGVVRPVHRTRTARGDRDE